MRVEQPYTKEIKAEDQTWAFLRRQMNDFRITHSLKETTWALDCKVLNAAGELYKEWLKNSEVAINMIKTLTAPQTILNEAYNILIKRKAIEPLEFDDDKDFLEKLDTITMETFGDLKYRKVIYFFAQLPVEIKLDFPFTS